MQIYALLYALRPMTPKLTTRPLASQQEGARSVYYTASKQRKKNSLQPINFFPRSLLSFAFLGWWLRLDIFRLGSIGCRCSFISFAVLALSGVAVLDVLVNLTFQHFVDVLLGHDFHAPGCRLRQKYFYGRSCHKKKYYESSPRVHHFYTGSCHRKKNHKSSPSYGSWAFALAALIFATSL